MTGPKVARWDFESAVLEEPCLFRQTRPDHVCRGVRDAHHVIPKQYLRQRFPGRWGVIYDPAVGVTLCRAAHEAVTRHSDYVFWDEVPQRVIDFAEARGILQRLERECPKR